MDKKEEVKVTQKSPIAQKEEEILEFWQKNKIFEKSLAKPAPAGNFVFYDGPPFATGLPHYGHILGSTIKDAIPRYQTMKGKHVARRWGWDCHGLPIENIVEKDLKISGKKEIEQLGVEAFNEHARSKVWTYIHEWKKTVDRIGRWVDFDHSYKTMDNSFIESVWWALKAVNDKGLIYEGTRVLPYCPRCETPIAQSEIAMDNSYKDITDISVYIKFELVDEPGTFLLAWTTTPWTLPGNTAAAVGSKITYVKVKKDGVQYILAKDTVVKVLKENFEIISEFPGSDLVGKSYKPIFSYFTSKNIPNKQNGWKVYDASYVTTTAGTGIVHLAPAFGEEDMDLAKQYSIPFVYHVGPDGKFRPEVTDFAGVPIKPKGDHQSADILIIKHLAHTGALFAKEKIVHSYPHCYRCETPLYYYAIPAWFIKITDVKEKLLKLNNNINWVPAHLKNGRFEKSMEGAPDWNISRNRFWASPLPIWKCDACHQTEFLSSLDEIKKKTSRENNYFLMRHGEGGHNIKNILSSKVGNLHHLTEQGKKNAAESARLLKQKRVDVIVASPLLRTKETAEIVADMVGVKKEDIIFDPRLQEINFGDWDSQNISVYHDEKYFPTLADKFTKPTPHGESLNDIRERVGQFMYEIDEKYKGKNILVVSHETPIWLMTGVAGGLDISALVSAREKKDLFINPGEVQELAFAQIPHNKYYELDFHRPYIDGIVFPCVCGAGVMKRIPEVVDCWFESAAMPFAALHYPFENKDYFKNNFPSQFVSEYIAQTRTWFYYTHAVSVILFDSIPFENVVTTGTVLAEDGQKMSKSKGNFPDPWLLFDKYGVDALRFYLLASPLMKSEDLFFSERGVDEVYKKIILRLKNVHSFFELYKGKDAGALTSSKNVLDVWILARLNSLLGEVSQAMDRYEIDKALQPVDGFIDDLSTWYLRRSRDRFKGDDVKDKVAALETTRFVLQELSKVIAPFMPFIAEEIYQKVKGKDGKAKPNHGDSVARSAEGGFRESVHLEDWPMVKEGKDERVLKDMEEVRKVVSLGLEARAKAGIKVRQPLQELKVKCVELQAKTELLELIKDEVNVKEVGFDQKLATDVELDTVLTPALKEEGQVRELVRGIQELRKKEKLNTSDFVVLEVGTDDAGKKFVEKNKAEISKLTQLKDVRFAAVSEGGVVEVDEMKFSLRIIK